MLEKYSSIQFENPIVGAYATESSLLGWPPGVYPMQFAMDGRLFTFAKVDYEAGGYWYRNADPTVGVVEHALVIEKKKIIPPPRRKVLASGGPLG